MSCSCEPRCACSCGQRRPRGPGEYDEARVIYVAAADFNAGEASVDCRAQGLDLTGPPWQLEAVHATEVRTWIKVRRAANSDLIGGTLPQTIDGLRCPIGAHWDGQLVVQNDPTDTACDHFLALVRDRQAEPPCP